MSDYIIFFDNIIESAPKAISKIDGESNFFPNIDDIPYPKSFYSLGYSDTIESLIDLNKRFVSNQNRVEVLFKMGICTAKSEDKNKWNCQKSNILGPYIDDKELLIFEKIKR